MALLGRKKNVLESVMASIFCVPEANPDMPPEEDDDALALTKAEMDEIVASTPTRPATWETAYDDVTQREYYYDASTGETSWHKPHPEAKEDYQEEEQKDESDTKAKWDRVIRQDLEVFLEEHESVFFAALVDDVKTLPFVDSPAEWPNVVDSVVKAAKKLVEASANLFGAFGQGDTMDRVARAAAEATLCLATSTMSFEPSKAVATLATGDDFRDLPSSWRRRCAEVRYDVAKRFFGFLEDPVIRQKCRRALDAFPKRAFVALAKCGALPTSRALVDRLVSFVVKPQTTTGLSIMQRLARASLGIDGAIQARDECLRRAGNPRLTRDSLRFVDFTEEDLDVVLDRFFDEFPGGIPVEARRALEFEKYTREARAIVDAYGDPDYVSVVCAVYPSVLCPLGAALQSSQLDGADLFETALDSFSAVLDAYDDNTSIKRVHLIDTQVGLVAQSMLRLAHRAALYRPDDCHAALRWISDLLRHWQALDIQRYLLNDHDVVHSWVFDSLSVKSALWTNNMENCDLDAPCTALRCVPAAVGDVMIRFGFIRLGLAATTWIYGRPAFREDDHTDLPITDVRLVVDADDLRRDGWLNAGRLPPVQRDLTAIFAKAPTLLYLRSPDGGTTVTLRHVQMVLTRFGYCS